MQTNTNLTGKQAFIAVILIGGVFGLGVYELAVNSGGPVNAHFNPSLGQQVSIKDGYLGCRDLQTMQAFDDAYAKAELAHDRVGKAHAVNDALSIGCLNTNILRFAGNANVIDQTADDYRVRFDQSGEAWWTIGEVLQPPAQSSQ